jgi:hypothetical protein
MALREMALREIAATAVLVSAAVHLYLWFEGMRDADVVGPAFLANAVGGAVIAGMLVGWRHWIPPLLAVGFGLSTLTAFVLTATVGLFGVEEGWTGWEVWTALVAEVVAIVVGALILRDDNPLRSGAQSQHHQTGRRAHLH